MDTRSKRRCANHVPTAHAGGEATDGRVVGAPAATTSRRLICLVVIACGTLAVGGEHAVSAPGLLGGPGGPVANAVAATGVSATGPSGAVGPKTNNWSGTALTGSGPYTSVSASWTQPRVNCQATPDGSSSFWVGLDGDGTDTVEQTGTEANCAKGSQVYYAWYELYPRNPVIYEQHLVLAGDRMHGSVAYAGNGRFRLTLHDLTRRWSKTTTAQLGAATLGSAEAVVEQPLRGSAHNAALSDFGTDGFSEMTVNGALVVSPGPGVEALEMVPQGTAKAVASSIDSGSFADTWQHP